MEHGAENGRYFLAKEIDGKTTYHLHIEKFGGEIWVRQIIFINYLKKNKNALDRYNKFKAELAEKYKDDRKGYVNAKIKFIDDMLVEVKSSLAIIFTGGGTAGHVTPNLEIIPFFINNGWNVFYIGSKYGMEKEIVTKSDDRIKFLSIHAGKLRRYFSLQNIVDIFLIGLGVIEAFIIIKKYKPGIIFSKGGFVSFPVVFAAWLNMVPVLIHESDVTPGLSNKLSGIFASKIFSTFTETSKYINNNKLEYIGPIIRSGFKNANYKKGYEYCGFNENMPVILVMGGSLGSENINKAIRRDLNKLISDFQIVHICGKGNVDGSIKFDNYKQFEYINDQFPDVLAMSQLVVARAGSNSIFEFLFMKKPMILIPLPLKSSRGDQILNAKIFKEKEYCEVVNDGDLESISLENNIRTVYGNKDHYINNMQDVNFSDNARKVYEFIAKKL